MIIQTRENKNLIIPRSLGNFSTNGGGTGGVTPEEAAEIASAVTEAAIDAYDADLQDDLNSIRTAVSGNTDDIVALAGDVAAFAGNVSTLSASTESGLQSANAAASAANTLAGSAYTRADAAYGLAQNAFNAAQEAKPFGILISSIEPTEWTQDDIDALISMQQHITGKTYDEVQGSYIAVGGVYSAGIYTLEHFDAESNAIFSASEGDWSGFFYLNLRDVMESYFAEHNSASSNDLEELSAATEVLSASTENGLRAANDAADSAYTLASSAYTLASSAYTRGDSAYTLAETLSAATETALAGKQDTLTAGSGISIQNNVISCTVSGGSKDYYINWAELYDMDYAPRRAAFIELVDKYNDGYHIYASGLTAANGLNVVLPLVDFTSGTFVTDRYTGGWAKFGGINSSGSTSGYYGASFNSSGNIAPDRQYLTAERFYTLPQATVSQLGGVKVGSGLTIDGNGVLSVSGGTGGDGNVFIITDVFAQNTELADFLWQYAIEGSDAISSGYPADTTHIYLWLGQDFQGAFGVSNYGFVELFPDAVKEMEGTYVFFLNGVYSDSDLNAFSVRVGYTEQGSSAYNYVQQIGQTPTIPSPAWTRFGNDERGRLTYDADNDVFLYDSNTIPTGDTTTVYADLIDTMFTDYLISGGLIFDYICPLNLNDLTVIKNGVSKVYAHPVLSKVEMSSPVTIDGQDFYKEITYNYGEYVLTALYGANDGNIAANLRISTPYIV